MKCEYIVWQNTVESEREIKCVHCSRFRAKNSIKRKQLDIIRNAFFISSYVKWKYNIELQRHRNTYKNGWRRKDV